MQTIPLDYRIEILRYEEKLWSQANMEVSEAVVIWSPSLRQ